MTAGRKTPPAAPYFVLSVLWLAGTMIAMEQGVVIHAGANLHGEQAGVLWLVLSVVLLAQSAGLFFLLGFLGKAGAYLFMRSPEPPAPATHTPPTALLYLTAGDFDAVAVDSLLRLSGNGPRFFVLHDDGYDEEARRRMTEFIDAHPCRALWEIAVWHRPERRGGKAGAVNWVLERLDARWELLLLCDSDSIALDPDALASAAVEFANPHTAVVQFRNVGFAGEEDGPVQRRLTMAIDVFDAFAAPQARWGYLPFFGHNAVVRIADLRALGGLTPGFFSDDLDLSLRLTLSARDIVYRQDIRFGERHPADWLSFRKRSRKWAFGCMQVVRARLRAVLTTPGVPFGQRVGMLEFMGFYPAQALLLAGLLLGHLVLPWMVPNAAGSPALAAFGMVVALALVAPTLAWAVRHRRLREWPAFAWACALVYGGSILSTTQGVIDGLSSRERPWIPTNLVERRLAVPRSAWGECLLGAALFGIPWLVGSPAVSFAATYLFVSTFLFAPLTYLAYREPAREPGPHGPKSLRDAAAGTLSVLLLSLLLATRAQADPASYVEVRDQRLMVDFAPFQVRGMHYSPWLPGTGPDGRSSYPSAERVRSDLHAIRSLGANSILVHSAPAWVIRVAWKEGLHSIYAFHISWNDTRRAAFDRQAEGIVTAVDSLRSEPGLMAWILGNEIPAWVVDTLGTHELEDRLRSLAAKIRARDHAHLLGHGNWPPTRQLDLSFLDLACFNLYPAWPYEVAVKGYGPYLRDVLLPAARGKPLLITEFGLNSLEADEPRQAQVLTDCWREISSSQTVGGVLFEWCDEWWKNYDNPIPGKGYWVRRYDPDDAARLDDDPEEHYGIVNSDRRPKLALAAAKQMWSADHSRYPIWPWATLVGLAIVTVWAFRAGQAPRVRGVTTAP